LAPMKVADSMKEPFAPASPALPWSISLRGAGAVG
jgi:hypothetical protein